MKILIVDDILFLRLANERALLKAGNEVLLIDEGSALFVDAVEKIIAKSAKAASV